ncbi:MAG TPA: helix-turn-helix transcriptional regulator [Candidatus Enterocloster excrementipullorum]|uniref:Helix-turn-helix transcriptional regulator n=1 Tax=Candidatus Enterocloster excrementipullorum TaxID=2838559 RepID=A0A9D2SGW2_9FIRM|nr:helix-turn-helix transcriptional regulator [Candidatus Enterocloster excrementipullorum]
MSYTLELLKQLADGLARQFGPDCEIVIHDLTHQDLEHSVAYIKNGHISNRRAGDGPSKVVLETMHKDPASLTDHLGYLTRTSEGKILKSSTMYIRNAEGTAIDYLLSINYDITGLLTVDRSIKALIDTEPQEDVKKQPEQIVHNVNDLLDSLIEQSVALIGKPVALMNKEEKVTAIQFLNDAGAFLITKSGDKVSKYFGISKFTLYSYIDVNSRKSSSQGG